LNLKFSYFSFPYREDHDKKHGGVPETKKVAEGSASRNIQRKHDHDPNRYVPVVEVACSANDCYKEMFGSYHERFYFQRRFHTLLFLSCRAGNLLTLEFRLFFGRKEKKQHGGGVGGKGDWKDVDDGSMP
jgi:hypothetical protein